MTRTTLRTTEASVHRIDLSCAQTDFTSPPFDVHLKFLVPSVGSQKTTLLAHAAAGKPDLLAKWLVEHEGIEDIRVAPGLAPKLLRAKRQNLPPSWAKVASYARIHHLDLSPDGHASWFVDGPHQQIVSLVEHLKTSGAAPRHGTEVRVRQVHDGPGLAPISRRQFEALSTAVALGYYEIPHRIDLRALAARTGVSLGSISELLRRAEAAILTQYIDSNLMHWPTSDDADFVAAESNAVAAR